LFPPPGHLGTLRSVFLIFDEPSPAFFLATSLKSSFRKHSFFFHAVLENQQDPPDPFTQEVCLPIAVQSFISCSPVVSIFLTREAREYGGSDFLPFECVFPQVSFLPDAENLL